MCSGALATCPCWKARGVLPVSWKRSSAGTASDSAVMAGNWPLRPVDPSLKSWGQAPQKAIICDRVPCITTTDTDEETHARLRSEERRVGKECRAWMSTYDD